MAAVLGIIGVVLFWRFLVLTAGEVYMRAGLPPEIARFEARSALTGAGYTTSQSEAVVKDQAARRVASMLVITGFIGPATVLGLLGLGFFTPESTNHGVNLATLVGLLAIVVVLERLGLLARAGALPARLVARHMFGARPVDTWLALGDHAIVAISVQASGGLADRSVGELVADRDVMVLAIQRRVDGARSHLVNPPPSERTRPGDELVLFGDSGDLTDLGRHTS